MGLHRLNMKERQPKAGEELGVQIRREMAKRIWCVQARVVRMCAEADATSQGHARHQGLGQRLQRAQHVHDSP
jgi:hypothetical protein